MSGSIQDGQVCYSVMFEQVPGRRGSKVYAEFDLEDLL